jgi:hypothetical protein
MGAHGGVEGDVGVGGRSRSVAVFTSPESVIPPVVPPRPFVDAILLRAAVLWVGLRAFSGWFTAELLQIPITRVLINSTLASLVLYLVILLPLRIEMARRSELVFLANLGYSFLHVSLIVGAECIVLEALVRSAVG